MNKPDYKTMYHIMVNAAEDAINILVDAQRKCEELYLDSSEDLPRPYFLQKGDIVTENGADWVYTKAKPKK